MAKTKSEPLKVRFVDLTDYNNLDETVYAEAYIYAVYGVTIREWWEIVRDFGIENVHREALRRICERGAHKKKIQRKGKIKNEYCSNTAYQA